MGQAIDQRQARKWDFDQDAFWNGFLIFWPVGLLLPLVLVGWAGIWARLLVPPVTVLVLVGYHVVRIVRLAAIHGPGMVFSEREDFSFSCGSVAAAMLGLALFIWFCLTVRIGGR